MFDGSFLGTKIIAVLVAVFGWIGILGSGLSFAVEDVPTIYAISGLVSSVMIVLAAQITFVLLGIEKNTRPAATPAATTLPTPAPETAG